MQPPRRQTLTTPDGWGQVFTEYRSQVLHYVYRRTGDKVLAEDITSEVFLRAMRGCSIYTDRGHGPRPWLLTLASRLIKDHWRSAYRRREIPVSEPPDTEITDNELETVVLKLDNVRRLESLIRLLPVESQRACLRLELAGLDRPAMAQALNRTPKAVKCLRGRALATLRNAVNNPHRDHRRVNSR